MTLILSPRNPNKDDNLGDRDQAAYDKAFADVIDGEVLGQSTSKLTAVRQTAKKSLLSIFKRDSSKPREKKRTPRVVALVPAHNEESDIGRTIDGLLSQTRPIDRIVVILDNCTDGTEAIVRRYKGITVQKTFGNIDKKVGALTQGWQRWSADYDFVLGVDGDTVLAKDALEQLEAEMIRVPSAAGVMCRYTFDINLGTTFIARQLIRAQRMDFASWLTEIMARNRSTYVLGGQATLFRIKHLQQVVTDHERHSPWDPDAQVEDMELTWRCTKPAVRRWFPPRPVPTPARW